MKEFRHKNDVIVFSKVTGTVIGSNKYSETHVSSSGGGGYVDRYGGHISAPKINSTAVTKHEFWIKTDEGMEKAIQLAGVNIPLREGQEISLIYAGKKGKVEADLTVLVNHNAGKHWFFKKGKDFEKSLELERVYTKWTWILPVAVFLFEVFIRLLSEYNILSIYNYAELSIWGSRGFFIYMIYCSVRRFKHVAAINNKTFATLDSHLETLAQEAYGSN